MWNRNLTEKVALVTGAASGIGVAVANRLAAQGARIVAADINEQGVRTVAGAIKIDGGYAIAVPLDVTSEADWKAALIRILTEWGRLDILINYAGISCAKPITDLTLDNWRRGNVEPEALLPFFPTPYQRAVVDCRNASVLEGVTDCMFIERGGGLPVGRRTRRELFRSPGT